MQEESLLITEFNFANLGAVAPAITPDEDENPFENPKGNLPPVAPPDETKEASEFDVNQNGSTVTITVVGASGDLAKKKIFPALFALYYEDCLPEVRTYASLFISILTISG